MKNVSIYGNFFAGKRRKGMTGYGNGENGKFPKTRNRSFGRKGPCWNFLPPWCSSKPHPTNSEQAGFTGRLRNVQVRLCPEELSPSSFQPAGWHAGIWPYTGKRDLKNGNIKQIRQETHGFYLCRFYLSSPYSALWCIFRVRLQIVIKKCITLVYFSTPVFQSKHENQRKR